MVVILCLSLAQCVGVIWWAVQTLSSSFIQSCDSFFVTATSFQSRFFFFLSIGVKTFFVEGNCMFQ